MFKKQGASAEELEWFSKNKINTTNQFFNLAIKENRLELANITLAKFLNKENNVRRAINAAEKVIDIYEKSFAGDCRPRRAIIAAQKWLKNNSYDVIPYAKEAVTAASYANRQGNMLPRFSASAAYATAHAATPLAYAPDSSASAIESAVNSTKHGKKLMISSIRFGVKLLNKQERNDNHY